MPLSCSIRFAPAHVSGGGILTLKGSPPSWSSLSRPPSPQALVEAAEYAHPVDAAAAAAAAEVEAVTPGAAAAAAAGVARVAAAVAAAAEVAERASSAEAALRAEAVEAAVSDGSRRLRVLVVDDDAGQRMVIKMMLVREGYEVPPPRSSHAHQRRCRAGFVVVDKGDVIMDQGCRR